VLIEFVPGRQQGTVLPGVALCQRHVFDAAVTMFVVVPMRWSVRPAHTPFSSAITGSRIVTEPSSQRMCRAARRNRHRTGTTTRKCTDCCFRDSPALPRLHPWHRPRPGGLLRNATHSHLELLGGQVPCRSCDEDGPFISGSTPPLTPPAK